MLGGESHSIKTGTPSMEESENSLPRNVRSQGIIRHSFRNWVINSRSMEIPIVYEVSSTKKPNMEPEGTTSPTDMVHFEFPTPTPRPSLNVASQSASYTDPVDGFNFDKPQYEYFSPLRVRPNAQRKVRKKEQVDLDWFGCLVSKMILVPTNCAIRL